MNSQDLKNNYSKTHIEPEPENPNKKYYFPFLGVALVGSAVYYLISDFNQSTIFQYDSIRFGSY